MAVIPDPYANKAIGAALTTLVGALVQAWATSGFQFSQEGVTALVGAVATFLVYVISNHKRLIGV